MINYEKQIFVLLEEVLPAFTVGKQAPILPNHSTLDVSIPERAHLDNGVHMIVARINRYNWRCYEAFLLSGNFMFPETREKMIEQTLAYGNALPEARARQLAKGIIAPSLIENLRYEY